MQTCKPWFHRALALGLVFALAACSVDVDGYEFVPDSTTTGDGDATGDGDTGDGDTGDGDTGDGDRELLRMADERLSAQWATPCLEGDPAAMGADPGIQYVYTFEGGYMRLDMWAFFSDCSDALWVQSIQADYAITDFDATSGTFTIRLTISDFDIMLLDEDVAAEANIAGPNGEGLYGRTDWVAYEWIDLLGYATDNGTLNDGDQGFIAFVFLGNDEAVGASLITLGAIPTRVLGEPFARTDGELSAEDL